MHLVLRALLLAVLPVALLAAPATDGPTNLLDDANLRLAIVGT